VTFLRYVRFLSALLTPILLSSVMAGQFLPPADLSLEKLNGSAGMVFSGTVTQIERATIADGKPAFVRVRFRVDQAVRGCNAGDTVTVDEWAELWIRGDRYRKGQRVLIFVYPPSQTGFSSPVAGDVGTFTIGPGGLLRITPLQARVLASQATSSQSGSLPIHRERDPQLTRSRRRNISEQKKRTLFREAGE
jgi:hypothetical protein